MRRTVREGNVCAFASDNSAGSAVAPTAKRTTRRRGRLMNSGPFVYNRVLPRGLSEGAPRDQRSYSAGILANA